MNVLNGLNYLNRLRAEFHVFFAVKCLRRLRLCRAGLFGFNDFSSTDHKERKVSHSDPATSQYRASPLTVWTALGAVYLIWGSTYLAIRFAVETLPPFLSAAARFITSGAFLYFWRRMAGDPALAKAAQAALGKITATLPGTAIPPLDATDDDYHSTPLGWAIHGSENGWHRETGDYAATVEALLRAGSPRPEKPAGSPQVRTALDRA